MSTETDPHQTEEYQRFVAEQVKHCSCCEECNHSRPCDGVLAGGPCDQACTCDSDRAQREFLKEQEQYDPWTGEDL